jgi:hypothetical protein
MACAFVVASGLTALLIALGWAVAAVVALV